MLATNLSLKSTSHSLKLTSSSSSSINWHFSYLTSTAPEQPAYLRVPSTVECNHSLLPLVFYPFCLLPDGLYSLIRKSLKSYCKDPIYLTNPIVKRNLKLRNGLRQLANCSCDKLHEEKIHPNTWQVSLLFATESILLLSSEGYGTRSEGNVRKKAIYKKRKIDYC